MFQVLDVNNTGKLDVADLAELFPDNEDEELENMLRDTVSCYLTLTLP